MYGGLSRKIARFSNAIQGTQPGEGKVLMAEVKYGAKFRLAPRIRCD
jgi:hypothetical protein